MKILLAVISQCVQKLSMCSQIWLQIHGIHLMDLRQMDRSVNNLSSGGQVLVKYSKHSIWFNLICNNKLQQMTLKSVQIWRQSDKFI